MSSKNPIYLDYNATTPIDPRVAAAMQPYLTEHFGNPSSGHQYGATTRTAVEQARGQVAKLLGCQAHEVVFTSGGTESNNIAIQGLAFARAGLGRHIITSSMEHPAVSQVCDYLESHDFRITRIDPDHLGRVDPEAIKASIRPDTILISLMHANNEVGTIQPIREVAEIARKHNICFHSDAAQSIGKIQVQVQEMGVDLLSVAAHKFYGPKGVGALYIREGITLNKFIHGADHESNIRPGTENVLHIVGLGKAAEITQNELEANSNNMRQTRDALAEKLLDHLHNVQVNGHTTERLPNTLSISVKQMEASTLLASLDGVAASAGAACHSDDITVSPTLEAMGIPIDWAMGTIRFSTGKSTTMAEIDQAAEDIIRQVNKLLPDGEAISLETNDETIKLTHFTHGLGCACKLRPQDLEAVLAKMPKAKGDRILVGNDTADDAAVYLLNEEQALVQTVDFFTPVVDDPYLFGSIAAANAMSDVYAMGAEPQFALNIVAFPAKRLPLSVLEKMLQGAQDKCQEAGIPILGGHTIEDNEPKFGMVVSGWAHPQKLWKNQGAKPGDYLILTKPLGLGVMTTALKRGLLTEQQRDEIGQLMAELNRAAARAVKEIDIHACTDITGFGLLGHLNEILKASSVSAELWMDHIPVIDGVAQFIMGGIVPGGSKNNLDHLRKYLRCESGISHNQQLILADAQTSGGLLFSVAESWVEEVKNRLQDAGVTPHVIGRILPEQDKNSIVIKTTTQGI